jgi:undecaprenyl-diphosphatase
MNNILILAALMGVVEGLTEFLPISSTGHLILAGHLLDFKELADTFEIVIQLGAILAVVAAYPQRFVGLLRFRDNGGLSGLRGLTLLAITSIPAAGLAYLTREFIKEKLFCPGTVIAALTVGAVWILAVEWYRPRAKVEGVDSLTWKHALSVGVFQCFSLWPGMSRSTSTILGGMMSGVDRKTATEYSFFAAVPIMTVATVYEFSKSYKYLDAAHLQMFAIGFVVSFVFAWLAVKLFIRLLSRYTLVPFGWYRLALAGAALAWFLHTGHLFAK